MKLHNFAWNLNMLMILIYMKVLKISQLDPLHKHCITFFEKSLLSQAESFSAFTQINSFCSLTEEFTTQYISLSIKLLQLLLQLVAYVEQSFLEVFQIIVIYQVYFTLQSSSNHQNFCAGICPTITRQYDIFTCYKIKMVCYQS